MNTEKINTESFELVAYRFSKLLIDERPLDEISDDEVALEFVVNTEKLGVRERLSTGKDIYEVMVQINMFHAKDELRASPLVSATIIGGFKDKDEDSNLGLEQFNEVADGYVRPLYWLARQRVSSMLTMTRLRSMPISWDLTQSIE